MCYGAIVVVPFLLDYILEYIYVHIIKVWCVVFLQTLILAHANNFTTVVLVEK